MVLVIIYIGKCKKTVMILEGKKGKTETEQEKDWVHFPVLLQNKMYVAVEQRLVCFP